MRLISSILFVGVFLYGCSSTDKSVDYQTKIKVNKATVQEFVSGIERGNAGFKFVFNVAVSSKGMVLDSVSFNGNTTKLFTTGNDPLYRGTVIFTYEEMQQNKDVAFVKNEATLIFTTPNKPFRYQIKDIKLLESVYMP